MVKTTTNNVTVVSNAYAFFDEIAAQNGLCMVDTSFLANKIFLTDFYPTLVRYNQTHDKKITLYLHRSVIDELLDKSTKELDPTDPDYMKNQLAQLYMKGSYNKYLQDQRVKRVSSQNGATLCPIPLLIRKKSSLLLG